MLDPEQIINARLLRPRFLRLPAPPYLLFADVMVFCLLSVLPWGHPVQVVVLSAMLSCFWIFRLYRSRLSMSILDDVPFLTFGVTVALLTEVAATAVLPGLAPSWTQVGRMAAVLIGILLARAAAYAFVRRARCNGQVRHTSLIIGAGQVGLRLGRTLLEHREYGLDVVGYVDPQPRLEDGDRLPAPLLPGMKIWPS
jgi:FlaA1/EpsC-like NDP-sugar epimerase